MAKTELYIAKCKNGRIELGDSPYPDFDGMTGFHADYVLSFIPTIVRRKRRNGSLLMTDVELEAGKVYRVLKITIGLSLLYAGDKGPRIEINEFGGFELQDSAGYTLADYCSGEVNRLESARILSRLPCEGVYNLDFVKMTLKPAEWLTA